MLATPDNLLFLHLLDDKRVFIQTFCFIKEQGK